jgi:F-box domain
MITTLHSDLLKYIFNHLAPCDLNVARFVSPQWRSLIKPVVSYGKFSDKFRKRGNQTMFSLRYGNLELLKWLYQKRAPFDDGVYIAAEIQGDLETVKYLYSLRDPRGCPGLWCYLHDYIYRARAPSEHDIITGIAAAQHGHLSILRWMIDNNYPVESGICSYAAESGDLEMVKYLVTKGYHLTQKIVTRAIKSGNILLLEWLLNHGCYWHILDCQEAIEQGHLHVLKWRHANGHHIESYITDYARRLQKHDIVEWALANGY